MRKNNAGNGGIEAGRNRAGNTASNENISALDTACHLAQEAAHSCAKMHERAVLSNRCAAACRHERGQRRAKARAHIKLVITTVSRMNGVSRTMPARDAKYRLYENEHACRT